MLCLNELHAWVGQSHVLHGVSLTVGPGEIVALLGRNGAGRSTTAKAIMGLVRAQGTLSWCGRNLLGFAPYELAHLGLGYVPEGRDVFPGLTVAQNLTLGQKSSRASGRWCAADMYRLFPSLLPRANTRAGVLSGGEQQMLALARTLMGDPQLIIIDEPAEGLAPKLVDALGVFLKLLKSEGVAVLLIEQKLTLALSVADRCAVLGRGRTVFVGTPAELHQRPDVRQEWLEV